MEVHDEQPACSGQRSLHHASSTEPGGGELKWQLIKPMHDRLAAEIKGVNGVPNTVVKGIEDEGDTMFLGIYNSLVLATRYKFKFKFKFII